MARITEQAIAEIEIDDKKAAERLKNLAATAERLKQELAGIGKDDKAGFAQKAKEISLVEKEMKKTYDQAVNVQKILKNLNGTSFNDLQKAQKSLTAQFKAGKISAEEYQRQIAPINRRLQELQQITRSGVTQQQSLWGGMLGAVGKFAAGLGIGKLAVDGFNKTMKATNTMADQLELAMAKGKAGVDSFFRTIATGDWGNLLGNMRRAIDAAEEYTKLMDELADRKLSMDVETSSLRVEVAKLKIEQMDVTKTYTERQEAANKIIEIEDKILTMRQGDLAKARDAEIKQAVEMNGVAENFYRTLISQYHMYEKEIAAAEKLTALEKKLAVEEHGTFVSDMDGGAWVKNEEAIKKAREELNDFYRENRAMVKLMDGSELSITKFRDQFTLYNNVTDEVRQKTKDAIVAVNEQQIQFFEATARAARTASNMENKMNGATSKDLEDAAKRLEKSREIFEKFSKAQTPDITSGLMADADTMFEKAFSDMTKELDSQAVIAEQQLDNELAKNADKYAEWTQLRQQLGLAGLDEQYRLEKAKLDELHQSGIMDEEAHQQALLAGKMKYAGEYAAKAGQFAAGLQSVVTGLEDHALQKSNIRKEKELAAAGDNAEARAAIEKKYAQEELDIKKKFADANFAMQVAQIISSTAVAAMNAYSAMAGIAVVGPVLGGIAAAAAVAAGAIQIASAKAARDQAKSVTLGGSSGGGSKITSAGGYKTGGFTGDGASDEPAGVVHRGEYVVPSVVMRNPAAIDHVRVLEAMRQSYYPGLRRTPGFLEGGPTDAPSSSSPSSSPSTAQDRETTAINRQMLDVLAKLTPAVETLNREGAWVSYERGEKARNDANAVKYRATRK